MGYTDIGSQNAKRLRWPMSHVWRGAVLGLMAAATLAAIPASAAPAKPGVAGTPFFLPDGPPGKAAAARAEIATRDALRAQLGDPALNATTSPGTTIPYWSAKIKSPLDGQTYDYSMIGGSPYGAKVNTTVTFVPIVVRVHYPKTRVLATDIPKVAYTFDPTKNGACDTQTVSRRFFDSPLFKPASFKSNGIDVSNVAGGTQLISAFQRANYWDKVKGSAFGLTLAPSQTNPIVVDYTPTKANDAVFSVGSACGKPNGPVGYLDIDEYDILVNKLAVKYATPTQIPVVLVYNVVLYIGDRSQCCVLGYHSATQYFDAAHNPTKTYVYAVGGYYDPTFFGPDSADINAWGHELAELADDPFVQSVVGIPGGTNANLTPAWGHSGQVSGCQNNLETGDPADNGQIGNYPGYTVLGTGGFLYHYQDEAFHDWFYRTPSTSAGHKGSFTGNLANKGQGVCL